MINKFEYFNHRGELESRVVDVTSLDYCVLPHQEYGHNPGWVLTGLDFSRGRNGVPRSFMLGNIMRGVRPFCSRQ